MTDPGGGAVAPTVAAEFSALLGGLHSPMMIVTVEAAGQRAGCLVGFGTQASIDPPRFLACLSRRNHTYHVAVAHSAKVLAVHFLTRRDRGLAQLFGSQTGDDTDKLAQTPWRGGPAGAVILEECESWFVGRIVERLALGDHIGFLLEPVAAHRGNVGRDDDRGAGADAGADAGAELTLQDVLDLEPGHEA